MRNVVLILVFAVLVVGCSSSSVHERVVVADNEILYADIVGEALVSSEASFFGVMLGDSLVSVRELHGEALFENEYSFGRTTNLEYSFGANDTVVLYHFQQGVLTGVLVTDVAEEFFAYDSLLGSPRSEMYWSLGLPTVSEDRHLERIFYYDALGYEVYLREGVIDRVYFTTPNRGIQPAGVDVVRNESEEASSNQAPILCFEDECFS